MFITERMRQQGQYRPVTDRFMVAAGIERTGLCAACGHKISHHFGVKSPSGGLMWVGSTCVRLLTLPDAPQIDVAPGTRWSDGDRELIVPSDGWRERLFVAAHGMTREDYIRRNSHALRPRGVPVISQFLHSISMSLDHHGQLTMRQCRAANRVMAEQYANTSD